MIGNFWNLTVLSEKSNVPLNNLQNYYFIGTSSKKTPLSFTDVNKVIALVYLLPDLLVQLPAGDLNISVFEDQTFNEAVKNYLNKHSDYYFSDDTVKTYSIEISTEYFGYPAVTAVLNGVTQKTLDALRAFTNKLPLLDNVQNI